jgi:hypothetical protein
MSGIITVLRTDSTVQAFYDPSLDPRFVLFGVVYTRRVYNSQSLYLIPGRLDVPNL